MGDDDHEFDPARYRYEQVADHIQAAVRDGRYRIGARLPSQDELAIEFGVARMTIRRAIPLLIARGVVRVLPGRGTFIISTGEGDGNDRD